MKSCKIYTFNVGQGLFNLAIGETTGSKKYAAVFDCGTLSNADGYSAYCFDAGELLETFDHLDTVVISHQDSDHWNNMLDLIDCLNGQYQEGEWCYSQNGNTFRLSGQCSEHCSATESLNIITYSRMEIYSSVLLTIQIFHFKLNQTTYARTSYTHWDLRFDFQFRFDFTKANTGRCKWEATIKISDGSDSQSSSAMGNSPLSGSNRYDPAYRDALYEKCRDMLDEYGFFQWAIDDISAILAHVIFSFSFLQDEFDSVFQTDRRITFPISRLFLGGELPGKKYQIFKDSIKNFAEHTMEGIGFTSINETSYANSAPVEIAQNIFDSRGELNHDQTSIMRNATSQVILFHLSDKKCVLFPGDATVHTFDSLSKESDLKNKTIELMLAPHHGSCHTNFAFEEKLDGSDGSFKFARTQPLENFLKKSPPGTFFISAKHNMFGHPSLSFLQLCESLCRLSADPHPLKAETDNRSETREFESVHAIYSTESSSSSMYGGQMSQNAGLVYAFPTPTTDSLPPSECRESLFSPSLKSDRTELPPDHLFLF